MAQGLIDDIIDVKTIANQITAVNDLLDTLVSRIDKIKDSININIGKVQNVKSLKELTQLEKDVAKATQEANKAKAQEQKLIEQLQFLRTAEAL
jgi:hypothetical protein